MRTAFFPLTLALLGAASAAFADEGMWTFHAPPRQKLLEEYDFELTDEWLDHVRLSSVRLNSGGSGSFVSPSGLVLTNHHVAFESIYKLSTPERDLVEDGFYGRTLDDELKCKDLEINVLVAMSDVTARVKDAVDSNASPDEQTKQRRAAISAIESEARESSGLRSNVVSLYRGGEYWLYQYKQYTDVRLVFAPEGQIGYFGGDPDNFTYPRYNLDFALLRVYEDGRPAHTPNYLRFNTYGLEEGDLVFVSGNPGRTERLLTLAQLAYLRDHSRPRSLRTIETLASALRGYAEQGDEQARQIQDMLFGLENTRKAYTGQLEGLRNEALMKRKADAEAELRAAIAADPELAAEIGDAFDRIAAIQRQLVEQDDQRYYSRLRGQLAGYAQTIVRYVDEVEKPNPERLPPFRDSSLDSLKLSLFSEAPIYKGMEETQLRASLEMAEEFLAEDDPFRRAALGDGDPASVASRVISGTRLDDPKFRRSLIDGGKEAVSSSDDPLIVMARAVDGRLRELEERQEEWNAVVTNASSKIAKARFAVYGNTVYPDATFTLRLAYGTAEGYEEDTTLVPWKTTFYGLFGRSDSFGGKPPYHLPERFHMRQGRLDLSTPLNFVNNCDITGGNSGSPTINRDGELVGLIFDGNIQSLPNDFVFGDGADRAVSVHAAGIIEALDKVYDAGPLVRELLGIDG